MKQLITLLVLAMLITACTPPQTNNVPAAASSYQEFQERPTNDLKKFNSTQELKQYLQQSQIGTSYARGGANIDFASDGAMVAMESAGAPIASKVASDSAESYSQTNIQVQGVDEADFVKNDDKYIYVLTQDKLSIIQAFPAEDQEILSETEIEGNPRDLFINKNKLIIFTQTNEQSRIFNQFEIAPTPNYNSVTKVIIYDITDKENPIIETNFTLSGNYHQSRMIGNKIHLLTQQYIGYYDITMPFIKTAERIINPDIYYFDSPADSYQLTIIATIDLELEDINSKSFMMGYASTVFVSEENIYVAYQKNQPYWRYEQDKEARFYEAIVPELPEEVQSKINALSQEDSYKRWQEIALILQEMYDGLTEREEQDLVKELQIAAEEWEYKKELERSKSIIHKIQIDDLKYLGNAEISGQLLNQFSMDEHENNLRVATTTYLYTRMGQDIFNNVYVLDEDMNQIGELENLAQDERIYSTRFIQDRLYMVTFERIDPFFVIDLNNPRNPEVLGELKIPGFSDYLHPYDENTIIGIGKETKENEWGGISTQGVKIALFDVTDVTNPTQIGMIEIGEQGSDSEALNDHKAFLFDKEKGILVLPLREVKEGYSVDWRYGRQQRVWQGAYIFDISREGIEVRGTVEHYSGNEESQWWYSSPNAIKRSLYMDDVLYTISQKRVQANNLDTLDEISAVKLPYKEQYYPRYYDDVVW